VVFLWVQVARVYQRAECQDQRAGSVQVHPVVWVGFVLAEPRQ